MNNRIVMPSSRVGRGAWTLALALATSSLNAPAVFGAGGPNAAAVTSDRVGRSVSEKAMLIRRAPSEQAWHLVDNQEALSNGDLILGLAGSSLDSQNGAVRLSFMGDLNNLSPYPIIESAVVLHANPDVDLDFTLDRGRVEVTNRKEKGAAHVRLGIRQETWDITLQEPGAAMAFEIYGRWPRGVPFSKAADSKNVPMTSMVMVVLKGEVALKHAGDELAMSAPPGLGLIEWDSVAGQDRAPQHLEKLPEWAVAGIADTPDAKARKAVIDQFRQAVLTKPPEEVLAALVTSDNPRARRLAVFALAALDDLPRLGQALRETKYPDVLDNGIVALRHWIGRGPGQDQILYQRLVEVSKLKPVHAETVMQLLHSFGDDQLARPETYQTLIDYLEHEILPIRALAYWHLVRLVPAGKNISYNPLGTKEEREQAAQEWRKLVPAGQVPERTKPEKRET
jgi:hypothetical protein